MMGTAGSGGGEGGSEGMPPRHGGDAPEVERVKILPLRNSVLFPMSVVPVNVGRPSSVRLVESLGKEHSYVGVIAQRDPAAMDPAFEDLYEVGTLARVVKVVRLGPDNFSVILNGICRFRVAAGVDTTPFMSAEITRLVDAEGSETKVAAMAEQLRTVSQSMLELLPDAPRETAAVLENVAEPGTLADMIASNLSEEIASIRDRQLVLEAIDLETRLGLVLDMVQRQRELLSAKTRVSDMVSKELGDSQREYVLRQQLKNIREELGESSEDEELDELRYKILEAELPDEARQTAKKQLGRLSSMQPQSAEYNVTRTFLEWLADLPWTKTTPDLVDVSSVRRCLDEDHWGLEPVKRRIVEFAAIRQLRADKRGPILLFVGPPGVGKTSLGKSIARAMGRKYGRIALGGVRDEAEVRGHRRTYVGALPGRIIQALKKAGTKNPVLVLDEVDKLGADVHGDPAAALLEVLDPNENHSFVDHFIGLPFDLSNVIFLATANYWNDIPGPLKDRLETIEVPGYPRSDKLKIAEDFLVPKQLEEHGLTAKQLTFCKEGLETIVDFYTREAGVRGLERQIAALCRDAAVRLAESKTLDGEVIDKPHVERVLGIERFHPELAERVAAPGVATGLGLTGAGGDLLFVEVTRMPGKGEVRVTGSLRQVMKESAATAVSFVRSRAKDLALDPLWLKNTDLHLHIPRGGSTSDAASAGVTMFAAVCSLLLRAPVRPDIALTGELTLRGTILPVHGVKAKMLAAHRAGIRTVLLPARNERDLEEVSKDVLDEIEVRFVSRVDQILPLVLQEPLIGDDGDDGYGDGDEDGDGGGGQDSVAL